MCNLKSIGLLIIMALTAACDGSGEVIDWFPDPDFPYVRNYGADVGDMDGDGLTDIVVAARFVPTDDPVTGHINLLLQDINSPGTFLAPQHYSTSSLPERVKLGDLNGDLQLDAVATHKYSAKSFDVLLQDPMNAGRLGASTSYTTVSEPDEIAIGDIDRDGFMDIVVAGEQSVAWHPQQANGSFNTRRTIGNGVDTLALGDFDGDGLLDVVTQDGTPDGEVLVYLQTSTTTGVFYPPQSMRLGTSLRRLAMRDLTGNGRMDVAAAGFDTNSHYSSFGVWYPMLQTAPKPPVFTVRPRYATSSSWVRAIAIADLNGDGRPDVVVGNWNGAGDRSGVGVFLQQSSPGVFLSDATYLLPAGQLITTGSMYSVSIADLNNDLLPDIVASNGEVFVLFQKQGDPGGFRTPVLVAGSQP